ncbi:MAG: ankyrin repeat domain-containing protein [Pseudomonadota bacterium]
MSKIISPRSKQSIDTKSRILFRAIDEEGRTKFVQFLLKKYPVLRMHRNQEGDMPIHHLCWQKRCDLEMAEILLDEESDSYFDKFGNSPLNVACENSRDDLIKLFIEKGHDFNRPDCNGNTVLHYLYFKNSEPELIQELIEKGADVNAKNNRGYSPKQLRTVRFDEENLKDNFPESTACQPHLTLLKSKINSQRK